jgi:hypothetical protein
MLTLDFFKNEIQALGLPSLTDSELAQIIRACSKLYTETDATFETIDPLKREFKLSHQYLVDNSITVFRSTTEDTQFDNTNILSISTYNQGTPPTPPTYGVYTDNASGYIYLLAEYLTDAEDDHVALRYAYTDYDLVVEKLVFRSSIFDRITEEQRGNVTIKKKTFAETLIAYKKSMDNIDDGYEVGEINFTRLSHGLVYGADPDTGEVLP